MVFHSLKMWYTMLICLTFHVHVHVMNAKTSKFNYTQVDEARAKVSETSTRMYNSVLDAHERSKDFDKKLKELTKEIQGLVKEKEAVEKRRTGAIKKHTELELDVKDLEEKISGNVRAKVLLREHTFFFYNFHGPILPQ